MNRRNILKSMLALPFLKFLGSDNKVIQEKIPGINEPRKIVFIIEQDEPGTLKGLVQEGLQHHLRFLDLTSFSKDSKYKFQTICRRKNFCQGTEGVHKLSNGTMKYFTNDSEKFPIILHKA